MGNIVHAKAWYLAGRGRIFGSRGPIPFGHNTSGPTNRVGGSRREKPAPTSVRLGLPRHSGFPCVPEKIKSQDGSFSSRAAAFPATIGTVFAAADPQSPAPFAATRFRGADPKQRGRLIKETIRLREHGSPGSRFDTPRRGAPYKSRHPSMKTPHLDTVARGPTASGGERDLPRPSGHSGFRVAPRRTPHVPALTYPRRRLPSSWRPGLGTAQEGRERPEAPPRRLSGRPDDLAYSNRLAGRAVKRPVAPPSCQEPQA